MQYDNNAQRIMRSVMIRLADILYNNREFERIDRIPIAMFPRGEEQDLRCCIYKARAVVRYRLMAMLGFDIAAEEDELRLLADYARERRPAPQPDDPILTIIDEACSSCIRQNYTVTDACRGCVARPCMVNCPKGAIRFEHGHSCIDASRCVNCGLCEKVCPYNAIVNIPVPCEKACPVKAVSKNEQGRIVIDHEGCILCGRCLSACPFGAIMERSQLVDVIRLLKSGQLVAALLAPAVAGQFPHSFGTIVASVKKLGFSHIVEVAGGADETIRREGEELLERLDAGASLMTTSCCPAWVAAAQKHIPAMAPLLSHTRSPMHYAAAMAREKWPAIPTVFIGPCIAKRREGAADPLIDYVLTFEELGVLLAAAGIELADCVAVSADITGSGPGRAFAIAGGVATGVAALVGDRAVSYSVNGFGAKELKLLAIHAKGRAPGNFCEVMACEGGCICGPGVLATKAQASRLAAEYVSEAD